jgi:hypothetical protein
MLRASNTKAKSRSLEPANRVPVKPGDVFELAAWVTISDLRSQVFTKNAWKA